MPRGIYERTPEGRANMRTAQKKHHTEHPETAEQHSDFMKERFEDPAERIRQSERMKQKACRGENHPNWQGGISFYPYPLDCSSDFRESIRERDNHTCQECGHIWDGVEKKLDTHHIDYDKENSDPQNMITLCRSCHSEIKGSRDYWEVWLRKFHL